MSELSQCGALHRSSALPNRANYHAPRRRFAGDLAAAALHVGVQELPFKRWWNS